MSDAFWPYAPSNFTETLNDLPNCTNKDSTLPLFITGLPECHIDDLHSFACEVWYQVTQLISIVLHWPTQLIRHTSYWNHSAARSTDFRAQTVSSWAWYHCTTWGTSTRSCSRLSFISLCPDYLGDYRRMALHSRSSDPKCDKQERKSPEWDSWCEAAVQEFKSLAGKEAWCLVPSHACKCIIGCKWVFKKKLKVN